MLQAVSAVQSSSSDVPDVLNVAPSPVLRIIIDNLFYPVTLDVLQQVGTEQCHLIIDSVSELSAEPLFFYLSFN